MQKTNDRSENAAIKTITSSLPKQYWKKSHQYQLDIWYINLTTVQLQHEENSENFAYKILLRQPLGPDAIEKKLELANTMFEKIDTDFN